MPRRDFGFSIQIIHQNGAPAPFAWRRQQDKAIDLAEETARTTGLEVRVWNTRISRVVYMVPAADCREVA
jgi:hypothetical protein